jgi:threonine synthase
MKYYSTNNHTKVYSFKEAFIKGLADDNGLFVPESIPILPADFFATIETCSLREIAYTVMHPFMKDVLSDKEIKQICDNTFTFDIPLKKIEGNTYALELFHGPTAAFKDVGARFLANCYQLMDYGKNKALVLVATSGDTGSAVANAFLGVKNVDVAILYPHNKVSVLQEKQFASLGENISAFAVKGTFDDCQHLVKQAFLDKEIKTSFRLSSANSINIARWLPQSVYYFYAYAMLKKIYQNKISPITMSVPTGNLGNLTAGLLAKKMGLPVSTFIAATNINNAIPVYLSSAIFNPKPSVQTISNAMDVGNPSNYQRMLYLYQNDYNEISKEVKGCYFTDTETENILKETYYAINYMMDPHGAIGYLALKKLVPGNEIGMFLETAHPAKFAEVTEPLLDKKIELPSSLEKFKNRTVSAEQIENNYTAFRNLLNSRYAEKPFLSI